MSLFWKARASRGVADRLRSARGQPLRPQENDIRDKGAAAIAEALRGNGVLTKLGLRMNGLGYEGKKAIQDAVSGREGFKLEV